MIETKSCLVPSWVHFEMSQALQVLIRQIANAQTEQELCLRYMDGAGELFAAQHWSIYLHSVQAKPAKIEMRGLPDHFIDYYKEAGSVVDPVLRHILQTHAPAHEQLILTEEEWKQSLLYREGCGKKYDHEHIMAGPVVAQGQVIGTLHFARHSHTPAFNPNDLSCLSALSAHLSVRLAILQAQREQTIVLETDCLTQRELQIAKLVATGLTNAEIGVELWISRNTVKQALKRIFRKLNVSSRAEMVTRLHQVKSSLV